MEQTLSQAGSQLPSGTASRAARSRLQRLGAATIRHWPLLAVLVHFSLLVSRRVQFFFVYDDMMNIYLAWVPPLHEYAWQVVTFWSSHSRPVGGLFYRAVYHFAGYNPVPFHYACLAFLLLNLVLAWLLYLSLGRSRLLAGYALLAVSFHGVLWEAYMNTPMAYDVLCATFYLLALLVYLRQRQAGAQSLLTGLTAAVFTILAIGAKEIGVTVPAVLLLYELLLHPSRERRDGRWVRQQALLLGPALLVSLAFFAGRLFLKGPLTGHPAYTPILSAEHILSALAEYTTLLFGSTVIYSPANAVLFWLCCVGIALAIRSRVALFGVLFHLIALLPMLITIVRSGYVLYIPLFGSALFVGALVHWTLTAMSRWQAKRTGSLATASYPFGVVPRLLLAGLVLLTVGVQAAHNRRMIRLGVAPIGQLPVRETAEQIPHLRPQLNPNGRVLLLNSPFMKFEYMGLFTLGLRYNLPRLQVTQEEWDQEQGALPASAATYQYVFAYDRDLHRYKDRSADAVVPLPDAYVAMNSPTVERSLVRGVGVLEGGTWRWTRPHPEFRFTMPARAKRFEMNYAVPGVVLQQNGSIRLSYWINGQLAHEETIRKEGERKAAVPLPAPVQPGAPVNVRIQVDKPYITKADQVRLGFIVTSAGLR